MIARISMAPALKRLLGLRRFPIKDPRRPSADSQPRRAPRAEESQWWHQVSCERDRNGDGRRW
jgi:hypothetical protein